MIYNKELLNDFLHNKVAVAVRTPEQWDKFMQLLEEETDLRWLVGRNPTELNKWHEWDNNSAITCGFRQPSRLGYADTNFYKASGYGIIEFEELIVREEKMTNQDYRDFFVKTKIAEFFKTDRVSYVFSNYKGYVLAFSSARQAKYFDFLLEIKGYGIERDEVEQIIIKYYLTEEESDEE